MKIAELSGPAEVAPLAQLTKFATRPLTLALLEASFPFDPECKVDPGPPETPPDSSPKDLPLLYPKKKKSEIKEENSFLAYDADNFR